jgi:putative glycosyltransferase
MKLSIVSTMYCSSPYLDEFYRRSLAVAEQVTNDIEFVFVNDGSPDDSLERAIAIQQRDHRVRVVDLSRNFGHHKAMMTGLEQSTGDLVFLIDCDLEEEPELLKTFHEHLQSSACDVVYGVQGTRKGAFFERLSGRIFFYLFNLLSSVPLPENVVTVRLMTRRYVTALVSHKERELLIGGLWVSTGFMQKPLTIQKKSKGQSSYTLGRKLNHLVNAITSFSSVPLVYVFYLGLTIIFLSLLGIGYLTINRIFFSVYLSGWPSVMVTVSLLGGLTIFCLGVIGIYLAKVFSEVKQRPYTIIRNTAPRRRARIGIRWNRRKHDSSS